MKTENMILTIKAENRPGLLHLITGIINKKRVEILCLTAAQTDIHEIVLITIEVSASEFVVASLALKLENVIEIFAVEAVKASKALGIRVAYFKLAKGFLETPAKSVLEKCGAQVINFYPDAILVAKYGSDTSIRNLYNELEGPYLRGFSQSGLIGDTKLIDNDEVRVIRLAA